MCSMYLVITFYGRGLLPIAIVYSAFNDISMALQLELVVLLLLLLGDSLEFTAICY